MPRLIRPTRLARPLYAAGLLLAAAAGAAALTPEPAPVAPVVSVAGINPDESIERDLCLTIAAGSGAAYECGDLRLVHGLPVTRTRDRARGPVLIYNTNHAIPTLFAGADVQLPTSGTVPDSVTADLIVGGTVRRHGRWNAASWSPGALRRIALNWQNTLPTGAYPYTIEVANWYGATAYRASAADTAIIVNRGASPYRPGWWIAGLESLAKLAPDTMQLLWIGGDGSTRIYRPAGTNVWKAEAVDRPDSLTHSGGTYTRHLPGGIRVRFDASGRHVATITRLGDSTRFTYTGTSTRVDSITLPVPGTAPRPAYTFAYGSDALLDSIVAPPLETGRRVTALTWEAVPRRLTIRDPDGASVLYSYHATNYRVMSRRDRMGALTQYSYYEGLLSESRLLMTGDTTSAQDLVTSFVPAQARALNGGIALDTSGIYTRLNGARAGSADTITFRQNRWGSPTRIVDALGNVTVIHRQDGAHPALPTSSVAANGFTTRAEYDGRGRLVRSIALNARGDGQSDTTRYEYDDGRWPDFVTRVIGPSGETTETEYNDLGNALWREDGMGARSSFRYYDTGPHAGRPRAEVQHLPGGRTAADSIVYDGTLGNVRETVSPLGFRTVVSSDGVGRPIAVQAPIDATYSSTTLTHYDVMGRDTLVRALGPAMPYTVAGITTDRLPPVGEEWTEVLKHYDAEGRLLSVSTHSQPDVVGSELHSYVYDRAGRRREEHQPMQTTYWVYDGAGNVTETWNERGLHTSMQYDLMNRLVLRVTPAAPYAAEGCSGHGLFINCGWAFPAITLPPDSATFEYDALGNLTVANNRDARVQRSYYPGGTLWTDSLRIRRYTDVPVDCTTPGTICPDGGGTGIESAGVESGWTGPHPYAGVDFDTHRYGITYEYDRSGRISRQVHPANLSPTVGGSTRYRYGRAGELRAVTDARGDSVVFRYDTAGRPHRTDYPGGVYETRGWDDDGRMTSRVARGVAPSAFWLYSDTLQYDARGKVLEVVQREYGGITARNRYSGLGTLVLSEWGEPMAVPTIEEYRADPLGHVSMSRTRNPQGSADPALWMHAYRPNSSALQQKWSVVHPTDPTYENVADTTYNVYDAAGNAIRSGSSSNVRETSQTGAGAFSNTGRTASNSYYGADEKLRFLKRYSWRQGSSGLITDGTFDEYWYDALGRRVLVRSLREDLCQASPTGCESTIERTVWVGDQVLYEIRAPGGSTDNLDAAPPLSHRQYGVVGYTHGGGIDQPLTVIRKHHPAGLTTIVPHANYRGVYRAGTTRTGTLLSCAPNGNCVYVNWPAPIRGAYHQGDATGGDWVGSLIPGMQDASGLLYKRNRYYNPATGQFTQIDPIGLAGGLNTYGFAEGDPITFSDPYGLKVCFAGSPAEIRDLRTAAEGATGAAVHLDRKNCISAVGASMNPRTRGLRNRLEFLRTRTEIFTVGMTFSAEFDGSKCENSGSHFCQADLVVELDETEVRDRRDPAAFPGCSLFGAAGIGPTVGHSGETIIAHELLGHAWAYAAGYDIYDEGIARRAENVFRTRGPGGTRRCGG